MAQIAYVNWDGLVYYDSKIKDYIKDKLEECIKFQGEAKRDQLPDPSYETLNFMYILSEQIISDEDFKNPGLTYPAGTIIQVIDYDNVYLYDAVFTNSSNGSGIDLSGYVTHEELEEYVVTEDDIKEIIENIQIPGLDTSDLVNRDEFEEVILNKAETIQFTDNYIVTKPLGGFKEKDSVQNLNIAEIFERLLGLQLAPTPDPDNPGGATPIVSDIINNKSCIYSHDSNGNLTKTDFEYVYWTEEEASKPKYDINTFYQIIDASGKVIESGYNESTEYNEIDYLTVALPDTVKDIIVKQYDSLRGNWHSVQFNLVKSDIQNIPGYTIWTVPATYGELSGSTYRFVIND